MYAIAARISGDSRTALDAFAAAARLAPTDPLIVQSRARAALEAGRPAVDLFERARALAPNDGGILLGMAAALVDEGKPHAAMAHLETVLGANPLWLHGQRTLAHLRGQMGHAPGAVLARSIAANPRAEPLHQLRVSLELENTDPRAALDAVAEAHAALGDRPWLDLYRAHATAEAGDVAEALHLFERLPAPVGASDASLRARALLRDGRPDEVTALLEPLCAGDAERVALPYLALAWRMTDDPRSQWLEGDAALVKVIDLAPRIADFGALADHLRARHFAKAAPLDQSVRGGTQTDGNLLLRDEEPLRDLRSAIMEAVDDYIADLPAHVPDHPTLLSQREPRRIAGSWSVRLTGKGYHTDHVHNQGWISSAFYVALPDTVGDGSTNADEAGWLTLGTERKLVPSLAPLRSVRPQIGRLVLFPSTMWHGTNPFPEGERLTVAFDIARPRQ